MTTYNREVALREFQSYANRSDKIIDLVLNASIEMIATGKRESLWIYDETTKTWSSHTNMNKVYTVHGCPNMTIIANRYLEENKITKFVADIYNGTLPDKRVIYQVKFFGE